MTKWRFSRSHTETDDECEFKLFMGYYYGGTGIVPSGFSIDTETGQAVHDILGGVLCGREFENGLWNVLASYAKRAREGNLEEFEIQRQLALIEGLTRLWVKHRLPLFLRDYRIIAVEEELNVPLFDFIYPVPDLSKNPVEVELMSRVDVKLQRKDDGSFFAGPEFKSTSYMTDEFLEGWRYSTQTMTHSLDIEYMTGEPPMGVIMEFLYKGFRKRVKGVQTYYSPIVMGRRLPGKTIDQSSYGWNGKGEPFNSWEEMPMKEWIELMPENVQLEQLTSRTINRNEDEISQWVDQTVVRQLEIQEALQNMEYIQDEDISKLILNKVFPKQLNTNCYSNKYHKKCQFLEYCFGENLDPLGSGRFKRRIPHHFQEFEA